MVTIASAQWSITGEASVDEGGPASYTGNPNGTKQSSETAEIDLGVANVDTTTTAFL